MNSPRHTTGQRLWLLGLLFVATWLYTWGLQRNLPYSIEADENIFVDRAVAMASAGDLNPGWFGNPGSTLFYPLFGIYRLWYLGHGAPPPELASWFTADPWPFYFLARLLSVAYTVLLLPFLYQIGRLAFTPTVGLVGVALFLSYPNVLFHIKSVRTDGVGLFFATVILWASLRLYQQPTLGRHLLAGASIGLGIASRYFLVLFTCLPLWLNWQAWRTSQHNRGKRAYWGVVLASLAAIGGSFALSTPYFFLDFGTAWHNLITEGRSTHPGADGLSPIQNFLWYCRQFVSSEYGVVQTLFAAIGLGVSVKQRRLLPLTLIGSAILFLAGISLSPLHWLRWALPIFPVAALLSAQGLVMTAVGVTRLRPQVRYQPLLMILLVVAMAGPGLRSLQLSIQDANPNTRLAARLWLLAALPADARVIQEPYTSLLIGDPRVTTTGVSLGTDHTLATYRRDGYTHLIISSYMYDRFLADSTRHPAEVTFYRTLLEETTPLITFQPTWFRGGPTIQIYALNESP